MKRSLFVATSLGAALAGCARVTNGLNDNAAVRSVINTAQGLDHAVIGTRGMADLYSEADISPEFRLDSLATPMANPSYASILKTNFASYVLPVSGLCEHPQRFSLRQLRALATLTQITRHDCVEGWSVVGKFTGVPLGNLLAMVKPNRDAKYVVFYSYDRDDQGTPFYGSLDMHQAEHPQTQLSLDLNGKPIDPDHGGPVRLKVPTQLGYKSTKWVQRMEIVASLDHIYGGKGGYWEDNGYAWYAGI